MTSATYGDYEGNLQSANIEKYNNFSYDQYKNQEGNRHRFFFKFVVVAPKNVAACSFIGAIIGAIIAAITCIWNSIIGAKVGAVVGAAYGINVSMDKTLIEIQDSYRYRDLKGKNVLGDISKVFQDFLLDDPILGKLICPISRDLPRFPVKAPDGATYDHQEITHRIKTKKPGVPASVDMVHDFEEKDLVFDNEHYLKVTKRIRKLILKEIDRKDLQKDDAQIIKDGLISYMIYRDDLNRNMHKVLCEESRLGFEKTKEKDIQEGTEYWATQEKYKKEYQDKISELDRYFKSCTIYTGEISSDERLHITINEYISRVREFSGRIGKISCGLENYKLQRVL